MHTGYAGDLRFSFAAGWRLMAPFQILMTLFEPLLLAMSDLTRASACMRTHSTPYKAVRPIFAYKTGFGITASCYQDVMSDGGFDRSGFILRILIPLHCFSLLLLSFRSPFFCSSYN